MLNDMRLEPAVLASAHRDHAVVAAAVPAPVLLQDVAQQFLAPRPLGRADSCLDLCHAAAHTHAVIVELHRRRTDGGGEAAGAPADAIARHLRLRRHVVVLAGTPQPVLHARALEGVVVLGLTSLPSTV